MLPFYKLLKKSERFDWTTEEQATLNEVKRMLSNAPVLTPPAPGETLLLYIAATTYVVSAVLMVEREEEGHILKIQFLVYCVNEVLSNSKTGTRKSKRSSTP